MADLFDLLKSQISGEMIGALTNQLGGAETEKTSTAVESGISILMNALAKNAKNTDGATALGAALDRDHDGSIFDDLTGYINGTSKINQTKAANGAGILGHLLGEKQGGAVDALSQMSGLNQGQSSSLLVKLAPIVLGMLGKQKRSTGMSPTDLGGLLAGAAAQSNTRVQNPSLITSLLDRDGDGSIADEAAGFGFKLLKNLFSKKR